MNKIKPLKVSIVMGSQSDYKTMKLAENTLKKDDLNSFGKLLHESWIKKKELSSFITNNKIDNLYDEAIRNGALGGKLLGAGGGGFLLLYMKKKNSKKFFKRYKNIINVPFNFTKDGSQVIMNNL